jgi:ComF family protein
MRERWVNGIGRVMDRLVDLAVPDSCQLCGDAASGTPLCRGCAGDLPWIGTACPVCARPVDVAGPCGRCLARPPRWHAAIAPLAWAFPVDRLVARLKYGGAITHARLLGDLLADAVEGRRVDVIVPVPLHPERLRSRGYNQALEIARSAARRLGVPLRPRGAERVRPTPPQAGLPAKQRLRNVKGAFASVGRFDGLAVAIVDDVLTTGATASDLARALLRAGAARVEVWTGARAGGPRPAGQA